MLRKLMIVIVLVLALLPAAALAQLGKAQQRLFQVVVGRQFNGIDTGIDKCLAQLRLALLGGLCKPSPKAGSGRVWRRGPKVHAPYLGRPLGRESQRSQQRP